MTKNEKTEIVNKGINSHLESNVVGNTLSSNIQNGDTNEETVENINLDETVQKETMVFRYIDVNNGEYANESTRKKSICVAIKSIDAKSDTYQMHGL